MADKANIFDIQRGSYVDGDGIRTVIFFKGCNLRCFWCHNPESWDFQKKSIFDKNRCTGCRKCITACLQNICNNFSIDRNECTGCGKCTDVCLSGAKTICGMEIDAESMLDEIMKDIFFYEVSGGGVTFSGGEPLLQYEFLGKIAKMCKSKDVNIAIDTAGYVPWKNFECILPYTDIFLYDIKAVTEEIHIAGTGVSNKLIIENLKKLDMTGVGIQIRVPVIPCFNNLSDEIGKIGEFIGTLKSVTKVELLPFHPLGQNKYEQAGKIHKKIPNITDAEMKNFNRIIFERIG